MKHHFAPWSEDLTNLGGFAKLAIQPGDAHSRCTHCGVKVKVAKGETSTKFWVNGRWTTKRPTCFTKPPVEFQGKAVVERDDDSLLIMLPDGSVEGASEPKEALNKIQAWFKREMNLDAVNVGTIEWRDGLKPPSV